MKSFSRWTVGGGRGVENWRCELRRWKIVAELTYVLPGTNTDDQELESEQALHQLGLEPLKDIKVNGE